MNARANIGRSARGVSESIELMRGGHRVSTLAGAFGTNVRETRITALLGYLLTQAPPSLPNVFGFAGNPFRIGIETRDDTGRSDIHVETDKGIGVIEAKLSAADATKQSLRYSAKWRAVLTSRHMPKVRRSGLRYVHWDELAVELKELAKSGKPEVRFLARDLVTYLQETNVARKDEPVEVYAREINEPVTLELFLKARVYGCDFRSSSRLSEARYFAPRFGKYISSVLPGIETGISYVSQVLEVHPGSAWRDFHEILRAEHGKRWITRNKRLLRQIRSLWTWPKDRYFLLLGEPRLVFNPPIQKGNLQAGMGRLSKQFYSFDELFEAWKKRPSKIAKSGKARKRGKGN